MPCLRPYVLCMYKLSTMYVRAKCRKAAYGGEFGLSVQLNPSFDYLLWLPARPNLPHDDPRTTLQRVEIPGGAERRGGVPKPVQYCTVYARQKRKLDVALSVPTTLPDDGDGVVMG